MFNPRRRKFLLYRRVIVKSLPSPHCCHRNLQQCSSPFSRNFSSSTSSGKPSFAAYYLTNQFGFLPEASLKCSEKVYFQTPEKPDAVISFFRNHGFSDSQIRDIIRKALRLLLCDPDKMLLPKLEFFLSKGASASDIVFMVSISPSVLQRSLENHIIPTSEFIKGFLLSNEKVNTCIKSYLCSFSSSHLTANVKMLLDIGVTHSKIARPFRMRPSVLSTSHLEKVVEEVKELGFNPSRGSFIIALMAKTTLSKNKWDSKVAAFKKWGWSEEDFMEAFKKYPHCAMKSTNKINALISFWVNHLGWSSSKLVNVPAIFGFSLEKRIIPRASVIKFLLSNGFMKEDASLVGPFYVSEELFLEKYVQRFEEGSSPILELYQESFHSIHKS